MRTTKQINVDVQKHAEVDRQYNKVINEGGEGYERDSTAKLRAEYFSAEAVEFAEIWTLEVTQERRAAWNSKMQDMAARKIQITPALMTAVIAKLGYSLADLRRARALHNL